MKTNNRLIGLVIVLSFSMFIFQTCFAAEAGKNPVETNKSQIIPGVPVKQAETVLQGKQETISIKQDIEDDCPRLLIEPPEILNPAPTVKKDPTLFSIIPVPDKGLLSDILPELNIVASDKVILVFSSFSIGQNEAIIILPISEPANIGKDPTAPSIPTPIPLPNTGALPVDLGPVNNGTISVGGSITIGLTPIPEKTISENSGTKISPPNKNILKPPPPPKLAIGSFPPLQIQKNLPYPATAPLFRDYNKYPYYGASFYTSYMMDVAEN